MCELLEFAFNPSSAKTTCVSSAREALKWLENERPDLMVLEGKRTCRDFFCRTSACERRTFLRNGFGH